KWEPRAGLIFPVGRPPRRLKRAWATRGSRSHTRIVRAGAQYDASSAPRCFGTQLGHAVQSPFRKRTRAFTASVFVSVMLWFRQRTKPTRCAFIERAYETVRDS